MPFTMYEVFCLTIFPYSHDAEFYVYIAHFCAQLIKASPMLIACKTAVLFALFEGSTQLELTIGIHVNSVSWHLVHEKFLA